MIRPVKRFSPANLERHRASRGLNPRQLAARLDIDPGEIRRYERGASVPGANRVAELAHALSVGIEDLYEPVTGSTDGQGRADWRKSTLVSDLDRGSAAGQRRRRGTPRPNGQKRREP